MDLRDMDKPAIDIVLPWVDDTDEYWLEDFGRYAPLYPTGDQREIRFRDWGLLRYWFRSVETFAPWVNKIHFITSGHCPDWLNVDHPKLNWMKHSDFIPQEYLPTFNINTIELNLHRIPPLSEHFIYFNDDIFILRPVSPTRFFNKGLPCDYGVMTAKPSSGGIIHMAINNLEVLEQNFDKHIQMRKYFLKWFNLIYRKGFFNNALLYPWKEFSGFIDPHLPNAFAKSTFEKVWKKAERTLHHTCLRKLRSDADVNQWLIRYWQLASGQFTPLNTLRDSICMDINENTTNIISRIISQQTIQIVCLNDSSEIRDFHKTKALLTESFECILPNTSSFEW